MSVSQRAGREQHSAMTDRLPDCDTFGPIRDPYNLLKSRHCLLQGSIACLLPLRAVRHEDLFTVHRSIGASYTGAPISGHNADLIGSIS